jgi:cytochrome P450
VYKAAFWIIAYLVHDQNLLARIREEIAPAIEGDSVNMNHLTENCPRLESLFNEVLRVNSAGALAREVIAPTCFAGKMLRKGMKLMVIKKLFSQVSHADFMA